jgi:predicted alpha/beta-hydrolase family hydrolase
VRRQDSDVPAIIRKVPRPTRVEDIETGAGPGRGHVFSVPTGVPRASLLLGHSSTGINSPDLATLAEGLPPFGIEVVLVEQPWSVAGRDAAPDIAQLDQAWLAMVADLRRGGIGLRRLAVGGRGVGARVACRTAQQVGPSAVLGLAFPLAARRDDEDRAAELALAAEVAPVTVVQGTEDRFGGPADIAIAVSQHGQRVLTVGIPFLDHDFVLPARATITDYEARTVLLESARRTVLRTGNTGPLLSR